MNKNLLKLSLFLLIFSSFFVNAQTSYKKFGFEVNGGLREYHGDLGSSLYFKNSPDYQGVGGAFGMYINPSFDINIYGGAGDIGFYKNVYDVTRAYVVRVGFRSRVTEGMIGLTYKFNNGYILDEDARFKPFLRAGWGAMSSVSRFTPESLSPKYEGYPLDRSWIASHWNAGLGLKVRVSDAIDLIISEQFNYTFDDNYDASPYMVAGARLNSAQEGSKPLHDVYAYHSLGLVFNFGGDGGSSYKIKDEDGDGISDDFDICPNTPTNYAVDTVGCPMDDDKDGVINEDDKCPDVPGLPAFNGCPDSDGDGITDAEDKCPLKAGPVEGQGCPDSDGDSVYDHLDVCPATPGIVENKGCPEIKEEVKEKIRLAAKGIFFESGKDIIKSESFENLDVLAEIMKEYK
ncbi:MAG: thrombospondin type 3 repeat-containing protein, partial [Bacteroidia bacterium]|nr:thrombospondin type 3 repeat-containing protein [Bacteroidia bacterium]